MAQSVRGGRIYFYLVFNDYGIGNLIKVNVREDNSELLIAVQFARDQSLHAWL